MGNDDGHGPGCLVILISIHVPAWGTTFTPETVRLGSTDFNPRSRVGNDDDFQYILAIPYIFQSTFPRGERLMVLPSHIHLAEFQSTFPRGERLHVHSEHNGYDYFNPRSRVGNDDVVKQATGVSTIFQSTFPRGERHYAEKEHRGPAISIHVPAWGTTEFGYDPEWPEIISIHVPAWGTT